MAQQHWQHTSGTPLTFHLENILILSTENCSLFCFSVCVATSTDNEQPTHLLTQRASCSMGRAGGEHAE